MGSPSRATIKRLFLRTQNRCAFPGCNAELLDSSDILIADICHICADRPGGPRFDPNQTEEERQGYANLIVLCPNHHTLIDDDEEHFSVDALRNMKRNHEAGSKKDFSISNEAAKRIAASLAAAALMAAAASILRDVVEIGELLNGPKSSRRETAEAFMSELATVIRYVPSGTLFYYSADPFHLRVGRFFFDLFASQGWRVERVNKPSEEDARRYARSLLLLFVLGDHNQLQNLAQAVHQLFEMCGFVVMASGDTFETSREGKPVRIALAFAKGRR
jgi:hypothetical protein